jgi:hypothetical protein
MTVPELAGLQIEVQAEGQGDRETARGKFSYFTPPLAHPGLQARRPACYLAKMHITNNLTR